MKRTLIGLCAVVALTLLLTGCGGGGGGVSGGGTGGGGVTPPSPTDAARYFPLTQGTQWVYNYSEDESQDIKVNGQDVSKTHYTTTGTDTDKIIGPYTGNPFPAGVTTTIKEADLQGTTTDANTGQQSPTSSSDRSFFTNENGVVKLWGDQHMEGSTWGSINAFPSPLVLFKPGVTSWTAGSMEDNKDVYIPSGQTAKLTFSGSLVAVLSQETITVPENPTPYPCYKVTYTLKNVQFTPPAGMQVISWSLNETLTVWLALDKGIVQSIDSTTFNATLKDSSGATINISYSRQSTSKLTSFTSGG